MGVCSSKKAEGEQNVHGFSNVRLAKKQKPLKNAKKDQKKVMKRGTYATTKHNKKEGGEEE